MATDCPPISIDPLSGRSTHARIRSSEDFPEPDGPAITVSAPRGNSLSTLSSAVTDLRSMRYVRLIAWQ